MEDKTKQQLKTSPDKKIFIDALNQVLDKYCDARLGDATTEERKYLSYVINYAIIKEVENKPVKDTPVPFTGE